MCIVSIDVLETCSFLQARKKMRQVYLVESFSLQVNDDKWLPHHFHTWLSDT